MSKNLFQRLDARCNLQAPCAAAVHDARAIMRICARADTAANIGSPWQYIIPRTKTLSSGILTAMTVELL